MIAILAIILLLGAAMIIGGFSYFLPAERSSEIEQTAIWEKSPQNVFMSKSHSYNDSFEFVYTPVNPNTVLDCYVSYHFQKNGNTLKQVDRKLYENVSIENPILLEFPRKNKYTYELDITIENESGTVLYESGMKAYSNSEKTK